MTHVISPEAPESRKRRLTGVPALFALAVGQLLSAVGTRMTNFALAVYVFERTGSTAQLTTMSMCGLLATALCSPFAGVLVDRWHRRLTIVLSDAGSIVITTVVLVLFATGKIQVWELFLTNIVTGALLAFNVPAYISTISQVVDKKNYPRAAAVYSMTKSVPAVFAPGVAAGILSLIGINAILAIDAISYFIAVVSAFLVAFPPMARKQKAFEDFFKEVAFGFRYIWSRSAMRALEMVQFLMILLAAFGAVLLIPFVLTRHGTVAEAGLVGSIGAVGGVAGSILLSSLKPTQHKVARMLLATAVFGLLGRVMVAFGHSLWIWAPGWIAVWFCLPFMNGYGHAIWQEKIDPSIQGRIFATRQLVEGLGIPLAFAVAGPLTDDVFEPQMRPGHLLAHIFGGLLGTAPGSGIALIFLLTGTLMVLLAIVGFLIPSVRHIESRVADFDSVPDDVSVAVD